MKMFEVGGIGRSPEYWDSYFETLRLSEEPTYSTTEDPFVERQGGVQVVLVSR